MRKEAQRTTSGTSCQQVGTIEGCSAASDWSNQMDWDSEIEILYDDDEIIDYDDNLFEVIHDTTDRPTWKSAECKWVVPGPGEAMSSDGVRWNTEQRPDMIGSVGNRRADTDEK